MHLTLNRKTVKQFRINSSANWWTFQYSYTHSNTQSVILFLVFNSIITIISKVAICCRCAVYIEFVCIQENRHDFSSASSNSQGHFNWNPQTNRMKKAHTHENKRTNWLNLRRCNVYLPKTHTNVLHSTTDKTMKAHSVYNTSFTQTATCIFNNANFLPLYFFSLSCSHFLV